MAASYRLPRGRPRGGEIYRINTHIGKRFTTMAPATRFNRWKTDGTLERINRALNQLDRKQ